MPKTDTKASKAKPKSKTNAKAQAAKDAKAARAALAALPAMSSETRIVRGIVLPWQRVERSGPIFRDGENLTPDRPAKGTVLDSGEVFIELNTLYALSEQDRWDSQFGSALLLGHGEGLALVAAGLAEEETRGGYHRTDLLLAFIESIESSPESK